jgi:hypothetical protein
MEEKIWMEVIQQNFDTNIESRNKHTQKKKKKKLNVNCVQPVISNNR